MTRAKISIRTRIIAMVLSLIFFVFLVIALVFNLLIDGYIRTNAKNQLENTAAFLGRDHPSFTQLIPPAAGSESGEEALLPRAFTGMPRGLGGRAEMFIVTDGYELVQSAYQSTDGTRDEETETIRQKMQSEGTPLGSNEIYHLKTSGGEYYVLPLETGELYDRFAGSDGKRYIVSYVNMTEITQFSGRINLILGMIMLAAGTVSVLIAVVISGRISRPVRELSEFSARIGQGNFAQSEYDFHDRELSDLAASMNRAAAQLEGYDSEQKIFFQNVSHELRTPLQSIRSNAEGISYGILEPGKSCEVIITETDRLGEMIDDILYLSRISGITGLLQPEPCDLRETLSSCAERQKSVAAARGLAFTFDFDETPAELFCDEKHMARAFSNLISNAIRYARGHITLRCKSADKAVSVSVADDGTGISGEDLPHIFERFYKGRDGKYGIGLAIVKSICDLYGGTIDVHSSPEGTVFTLTFRMNKGGAGSIE